MRTKLICQYYLSLETADKINLLVAFIKWFVTQSKLSLIFTKTLLFPYKTACFLNESHDSFKNADSNSEFHITKLIPFWKFTF